MTENLKILQKFVNGGKTLGPDYLQANSGIIIFQVFNKR
jgi:hypothetical protein